MTELSFLLDLLLNHKLPKSVKEAVTTRIREVEANPMPQRLPIPSASSALQQAPQVFLRPPGSTSSAPQQAPSTLAAMARHPDLAAQLGVQVPTEIVARPPEPPPVAVVAQTAATMTALQSRAELIDAALSKEGVPAVRTGQGTKGAMKFRGTPG